MAECEQLMGSPHDVGQSAGLSKSAMEPARFTEIFQQDEDRAFGSFLYQKIRPDCLRPLLKCLFFLFYPVFRFLLPPFPFPAEVREAWGGVSRKGSPCGVVVSRKGALRSGGSRSVAWGARLFPAKALVACLHDVAAPDP